MTFAYCTNAEKPRKQPPDHAWDAEIADGSRKSVRDTGTKLDETAVVAVSKSPPDAANARRDDVDYAMSNLLPMIVEYERPQHSLEELEA